MDSLHILSVNFIFIYPIPKWRIILQFVIQIFQIDFIYVRRKELVEDIICDTINFKTTV